MLLHGSPRTQHHFYLIVISSQLVRWYYKGGSVSNEAPAEGLFTGRVETLLQILALDLTGVSDVFEGHYATRRNDARSIVLAVWLLRSRPFGYFCLGFFFAPSQGFRVTHC
jgi:hypothetical protein